MLKALSQRYPGQLELVRAPLGATPLNLRMQAQTAARYEDILAHVTLTGAGSRDSRLLPIWDQTRVCCMGPGGLATPETGGRLRGGRPPQLWSMSNPGPDDDLGPRSMLRSWSTQNRPLITAP